MLFSKQHYNAILLFNQFINLLTNITLDVNVMFYSPMDLPIAILIKILMLLI